jgi:dTDP-4-amino-4,6-dideoxygalactose transaminase|tara:strand:- start:18467 stop:19555 length:1089 start_codon:yes stop_codon:yes gene_type:complete
MKFLDISNQDKKLKKKIFQGINTVIKNSDFILGKKVKEFEDQFSKFCDSNYGIGCANGTDALILALESLNLPKNSEIILPAMTWCSTLFAVIRANLKPVLVDIKDKNPTICPYDLKKKITNKTKAIILVHLYGDCCDLKEIKKIIKGKKIFIIEDAAQAHGGYDVNSMKKVGSLGDLACFSFYPGKNLGAYGDAGFITTNNKILYNRLLKLRNMGAVIKHHHEIVGTNSRLDTIQAVVLIEKMKNLDSLILKRKYISNFYNNNIKNKNIEKLDYTKGCVYHQYVIKSKKIEKLLTYLKQKKIPFGRHYPKPLHKLKAVNKFFKKQRFKNSEKLAYYGVSIPTNPLLKLKDLKYICESLNKFS